jgi:ParB-like chromosome segregation protein Spo0J
MPTSTFKTRKETPNGDDSWSHAKPRPRIEMLPLSKLRPARRNAHQHPEEQIRQIMRSIEQFGFINPVVVDNSFNIVAGHGRFAAAQLLHMQIIPVIRVSHLSWKSARSREGANWRPPW